MSFRSGRGASILDAAGETPLVELRRLFDGFDGRVLAKLEYLNPSGSTKDRVARQVLRDARQDGRLAPHRTVVAEASGGACAAFALACASLGHPFLAVEPAGADRRRRTSLAEYGAELVGLELGPEADRGLLRPEDVARLGERARAVAKERGAFLVDLFQDLGSFRAHRLGTGPEILRQSGGEVQAFCDVVGTGGTFAGTAAALKEYASSVSCYVAEPVGAAVLAGLDAPGGPHAIPGRGYGFPRLTLLDPGAIDGYVQVGEDEARRATLDLARREGIPATLAGGANLAAARRLLDGPWGGRTVAIVLDGES